VADDLAATKVFDSESKQPVLLVRLEHGRVGVRTEVRLAAARVDEVAPIVLATESEIIILKCSNALPCIYIPKVACFTSDIRNDLLSRINQVEDLFAQELKV
jgi:hypothetical protein